MALTVSLGPIDAAWFAFFFPLISFCVVFGPFLLSKKIVMSETLINDVLQISIFPLFVSFTIFFIVRFAVSERRFKVENL